MYRFIWPVIIGCCCFSSSHALANTLAAKALDRQGLIGEWEGVDTSCPYAVYKMVISAEGEADLILLYSGSKNESMSILFGHAKSIECDDGEVKIRFEMAPKHIKYFTGWRYGLLPSVEMATALSRAK